LADFLPPETAFVLFWLPRNVIGCGLCLDFFDRFTPSLSTDCGTGARPAMSLATGVVPADSGVELFRLLTGESGSTSLCVVSAGSGDLALSVCLVADRLLKFGELGAASALDDRFWLAERLGFLPTICRVTFSFTSTPREEARRSNVPVAMLTAGDELLTIFLRGFFISLRS